jgi:hypothetical protein
MLVIVVIIFICDRKRGCRPRYRHDYHHCHFQFIITTIPIGKSPSSQAFPSSYKHLGLLKTLLCYPDSHGTLLLS